MNWQTELFENRLMPSARILLVIVAGILSGSAWAAAETPAVATIKAPSQDAKCVECHDDIFEEPVVHAAMEKGCRACHTAIDATKRPHAKSGKFKSGLSADEPELCLACHDKAKFRSKTTHEALAKGCIVCHEAHSSKHKKLVKSAAPAQCFSCHDKKGFSGPGTHGAVSGGSCSSCHSAHASEQTGLLVKPPAKLCLDCHDGVREAPHVIAGFSRSGHPLGDGRRSPPAEDPLRPGKPFYCASCHQPHKSEFPQLLRLDPKVPMGWCQKCHQM